MRSKTLLRSQLAFVAVLTLLFAICVPSLMAQSAGTSALSGTITDPSGAAVPGVTVTITSNETAQTRSTTTGPDGVYKFNLLPPGSYKIRFAANGFKTSEVGSVNLAVTESSIARSGVGGWRAVRTGDGRGIGRNAPDRKFHARNHGRRLHSHGASLKQSQLHPGPGHVGWRERQCQQRHRFRKGDYGLQHQWRRSWADNFQMDGVAVNNIANGGSSTDAGIYAGIPIPNPDAIQEFKIQTSTYDASYGRNPGANVNVITKSVQMHFTAGCGISSATKI